MEIVVSQEQGRTAVTVFRIKGNITSDVELREAAQKAYDNGTRNLLLDLKEVPYMSSPGLRALHVIYTMLKGDSPEESDEAAKYGIIAGTFTSPHLKLLNPTSHVLEVLKTAGFDMFLEIHNDYQSAIASY